MTKRALKNCSFILIISLAWWVFAFSPAQGLTCDVSCSGTEFGIATDPPHSFLNMSNMAPGGRVSANLTVKNTGHLDFSYKISAFRETGSVDLYNCLILDLTDSNGTVWYAGPLGGLSDLDLGCIAAGCRESLSFTVTFQSEAGNELQGQGASVKFVFAARSHEGDIVFSDKVIFEPPVINHNFKLKIGSTVPFKFHLVKADGSLDCRVRPDLALEVTGPGLQGGSETYIFRVGDGTIRFAGELCLPHYIVNFSTRDYPVQPLGWYTARVVENGAELGSVTFQADTAPGTGRGNNP